MHGRNNSIIWCTVEKRHQITRNYVKIWKTIIFSTRLHIVHFPCNYIVYTVLNINFLLNVFIGYLLLRHVWASTLSRLQGARNFFDVWSFCGNLCGRESTYMVKIIFHIRILKSFKSVCGWIQYEFVLFENI